MLPKLKLDICNCFFKITNSKELIDKAINSGGLIQKKRNNIYKYNPMFKKVLQAKARENYNTDRLIDEIETIYSQNDNLEQVMIYNLKANNQNKVIDLIKENIERLLDKNKIELLKRAFRSLSESDFNANPSLYLYQGDLYRKLDKFHQAIEIYQQAENLFKKNNNEQLLEALFRLANLFAFFSSNRALEYIKKLENYKAEFTKEENNNFFQLDIIRLLIKGKFRDAELAVEKLKGRSKENYQELKVNILFRRGKFFKAKELLEQLRFNDHSDYVLYYTLVLPVLFYLFTGKLFSAQRYIWSELSDQDGYINKLGEYYLLIIYQLFGIHKIDFCKQKYLDFLDNTQDCPFDISRYKIDIFQELISWEICYGDLEQGLEYSDRGLMVAIKRKDVFAEGKTLLFKGINYYYLEQFSKAEESFNQAIKKLVKSGAQFHFFIALLGRADSFYQQDKIEEFKVDMKQAISYLKNNPYDKFVLDNTSTLIRDSNLIVNLFNNAKQEGLERNYINKLFNNHNLKEVGNSPNYMIKVCALGTFKLFRGNEEVLEDEWERRKSKELLKLFLVNYGELISKDKICSLLWPNKNKESAYRSFYVALNNLNKVLEPNRKSRKETYFISKRDKYYGLIKDFVYHYDVKLFEKFIEQGEKSNEERIKAKFYQEAVSIYSNDFLVDDLEQDWIIDERERLEQLYLEIVEYLMKYRYEMEDYQQVIKLADQILNKNRYIEPAYLYKIMSYDQLGKRAIAITVYESCEKILNQELDINPNSKLKEYYKYLKISN